MNAFSHLTAANDDVTMIAQIARLVRAWKDASKADVYCQSDDYERCWEMVEVEKIELRRLLINAGIDWRAFEGSLS